MQQASITADGHAGDLALRAALSAVQGLPPCLGRFIGEVWVIADWGSIPFFPFADRLSMAREIENRWSLLDTMRSHNATNWTTQTTILTGFVDDLEKKAYLLPTPGTKRRQLSFLSKYLYFCINDAFPIWDSNARAALGHKISDTTWPSYKTWLIKVRQEADNHSAFFPQDSNGHLIASWGLWIRLSLLLGKKLKLVALN